ncbi:MAG: chemotaxis protein CheW [Methylobacteriaceae bacterium]|nr:chemotaxis protein CheW [Methylobacteriaceae bacterium]
MLFLLFRLGDDCYALDCARVVEILPLLAIKKMLQAPPGIAGMLNYHGSLVPIVDLSEVALGRPAEARLSTRIVLARHGEEGREPTLFGMIAENATETLRCEPADFEFREGASNAHPGPLLAGPHGPVQRMDISGLLPASVNAFLSGQPAVR